MFLVLFGVYSLGEDVSNRTMKTLVMSKGNYVCFEQSTQNRILACALIEREVVTVC